MKVQIKDLKPNPFRDMKNYSIIPEKIESLTKSINQTGFWDNILARRNNGKIEIAYGHHRLVVLKKLFKPNDYVDIPIRKLDDPMMIRIMANENDESWGTNPKVIKETVKVVIQYLKNSYIINNITPEKGGHHFDAFEGLPLPKSGECEHSVIAWQVSDWLGGNWSEQRIYLSLFRLGLIEGGKLDKEADELLPHEKAATRFAKATERIKGTTHRQQKRAAKRIIESEDFSKSGIESVLFEEKFRDEKTIEDEEERYGIQYRDIVLKITRDTKILNEDLEKYFVLKDRITNFEKYIKKHEMNNLTLAIHRLRDRLNNYIKGEKYNEKNKLYQINN